MAAFRDEMERRRKSYKDEVERRQTEASRQRLVAAGLWPAPRQEQQEARQDAQEAPGGQEANALMPAAPRMDMAAMAAQRAQAGRAMQAARLGGMIDRVEQAHRDENDSRVAQAREARRMEFARDIERMRQEALLQRLAMEQQQQASYAPPPSGHMRVFNPNALSWDYTDSVTFGG